MFFSFPDSMTLNIQINSLCSQLMKSLSLVILLLFYIQNIQGQLTVSTKKNKEINQFPVVSDKIQTKIIYDSNDYTLIKISAHLLADDIERVSGKKPEVITEFSAMADYMIIIGSADKSNLTKQLSDKKKIGLDVLTGRWEQFSIKTITNPFQGVKHVLVISGSDRRGTAYGVIELSRAIGVSPWYWWADAAPEKKPVFS